MGYAGCGFDHCKTAKTKVGQFFGNLALTLKFLDNRSQLTSILRMWVVLSGKFLTAHGRSRPEVSSGFPIEAYGSGGVSLPSRVIGNS